MGPRRHRAVDFLDGEGGRPDRKALSYVCHRSCPITFIAFLCGDLPLLFVCSHLLPSLTIKQEHQSLCCCDNRPIWTPSRPPFPLPSVHTGFPNWLDQPVDSDPLSAAAQSGDLADEYELRPLYVPSFMAAMMWGGMEGAISWWWTQLWGRQRFGSRCEVKRLLVTSEKQPEQKELLDLDLGQNVLSRRMLHSFCKPGKCKWLVTYVSFLKKKLTLLCWIKDSSWPFKVTFWTIHFSFNPVQAENLLIFASSQSSRPR